jgi:hypothetical protein
MKPMRKFTENKTPASCHHQPHSPGVVMAQICVNPQKQREKERKEQKRKEKNTPYAPMIHSLRAKSLSLVVKSMFCALIVYLGDVPIAVPGDEEVLAIGLVVDDGTACLDTACCLILRRRASSLSLVPLITIKKSQYEFKQSRFHGTYT